MNAGEMKERIGILEYDGARWQQKARVWAKVEPHEKTGIFSKYGFGSAAAVFTMRRFFDPPTLHSALSFDGAFYLLTAIADLDRQWLSVTGARVRRTDITGPEGEFEGVLAEKYTRYELDAAYSATEKTLVLVTPKAIVLGVDALLTIDQSEWNVQTVHTLDEYKNEYEITKTSWRG